MATWKVRGTREGNQYTVTVEAANKNEAIRAGSHAPHMLCVESVCIIDPVAPFVDVAYIIEQGLEQKLSAAIRCF